MKVRGFQAKWTMLVLVSKDSFPKWYHFVQMGAYWNGLQVFQRKFPFSLYEKSIFHFPSAKSRVFLWRIYQILGVNLNPSIFVKKLDHILLTIEKRFPCKKNYTALLKKTNLRRFSWNGSNLNYMCLIVCSLFFQKIISRYTSNHIVRDPPRFLQDSTP